MLAPVIFISLRWVPEPAPTLLVDAD